MSENFECDLLRVLIVGMVQVFCIGAILTVLQAVYCEAFGEWLRRLDRRRAARKE